jgi:myo-inositol-1(or 4)-monophosphatase
MHVHVQRCWETDNEVGAKALCGTSLALSPDMSSSEFSSHPALDGATIAGLEHTAFRLASAAGQRICTALRGSVEVDFKPPDSGRPQDSNPVSDVDRDIESFIRSRLAIAYPDHAVIGEELPTSGTAQLTWIIDPIDGTSNFINGLPLFACSVGVLYEGHPVAGAIWCATSHTLMPGTYHAATGSQLKFDGRALSRRSRGRGRGLAAEPGCAPLYAALWDTRVLGCATIEFAFVASGLLSIAYIPRPRIWDAAAGLALLRAADCRAVVQRGAAWDTMLYFQASQSSTDDLAGWSEPLLIGTEVEINRAIGRTE